MTREEAIKILKEDGCGYCTWQSINPYECENKECEVKEALEMAIKAIEQNESAEEWYKLFVEKLDEQEPCDDAISREAATNGDIVEKIFGKNVYCTLIRMMYSSCCKELKEWWNAPYQKGGE